MRLQVVHVCVVLVATFAACNKPAPSPSNMPVVGRAEANGTVLEVSAKRLSENRVELTITTNIPLPIEVMASLELQGQKGDDFWIGYNERARVDSSPQVVILDASRRREPLPVGRYEAEVFFNSVYAKNPQAANIKDGLTARAYMGSMGVGESAVKVVERMKLQDWAFDNIFYGTAWDKKEFVARFGPVEQFSIPADVAEKYPLRNSEGYYFPEADITILVSSRDRKIVVLRTGRATH